MNDHVDRERRTARVVRACYTRYIAPRRVTAKQLYALCQLTWITKGGANLNHGLPDNTRKVVAPALTALTGARITATAMSDLPDQLKRAHALPELVRLVENPLGIVNFYTAFREDARGWLAAHQHDLRRMVKLVASASSDHQLREAYATLDELPPLRHQSGNGGAMPPVALISPMLACLDPRSRAPIINSRETVRALLRGLGLHHATVGAQFDGLVNLVGQAGIRDAFDLDVSSMSGVVAALKVKRLSRGARRRASPTRSRRLKSLDERHDADVQFFRHADTVRMRRLHHTMTNALRRFCGSRRWVVEEGVSPEYMFDALIREYNGNRHLLIEVKADSKQPTCRLAIGQLLDYRRQLKDRARIDLGVLFPNRPSARAAALLKDVGAQSLWFTPGMKAVKGIATP